VHDVVQRDDGERLHVLFHSLTEGGHDQPEDGLRGLFLSQQHGIRLDPVILGVEQTRGRVNEVAALGDSHRHDLDVRVGQPAHHPFAFLRAQIASQAADHALRGAPVRGLRNHGVQQVLALNIYNYLDWTIIKNNVENICLELLAPAGEQVGTNNAPLVPVGPVVWTLHLGLLDPLVHHRALKQRKRCTDFY
jgi:hypothetical protein